MNISKLKAVIQAANPEILELKFGCEVMFQEEKGIYIHGFLNEHWVQFYNYKFPPQIINRHFEHHLKILGRPIRLADVVWAMLSRYSTASREFIMLLDLYNFRNDNLDNQSDECKQFLIELLCQK